MVSDHTAICERFANLGGRRREGGRRRILNWPWRNIYYSYISEEVLNRIYDKYLGASFSSTPQKICLSGQDRETEDHPFVREGKFVFPTAVNFFRSYLEKKRSKTSPKIGKPVLLATALTVVSVFLGEFMPKSRQQLEFRYKEGCKNLWARIHVATSMATWIASFRAQRSAPPLWIVYTSYIFRISRSKRLYIESYIKSYISV